MPESPINITSDRVINSDWENEQKYKSAEPVYIHGLIDDEQRGNLVGHFIIEREASDNSFKERNRYTKLNSVSVFPHPAWRHKGLGSSMVREFERLSKDFGASKIIGEIGSADYKEEPWLPDFYTKLGFELTKKGEGFIFEKTI